MTTFTSTGGPIAIADQSRVVSLVQVSGLSGTIVNVSVTLNGLSHTAPFDLDFLLNVQDPAYNFLFMSDIGGSTSNVTLTLSDSAITDVPLTLSPGVYLPTNVGSGETGTDFGLPAIQTARSPNDGSAFASIFSGLNPNTNWFLYIADDSPQDAGSLVSWSLNVTSIETYFAVVPGGGVSPQVNVDFFTGTNAIATHNSFSPFSPSFTGGLSVAQLADGRLAVGTASGDAQVAFYDMATGTLAASFLPFENFVGGVDLSWFDAGHLAVGAGAGGEARVNLYDATDPTAPVSTGSFLAFSPSFHGGVDVAWLDATHVAVGAASEGSQLAVFDVAGGSPTQTLSLTPFGASFSGGLHLAGSADGRLAVGAASNGGQVAILDAAGSVVASFTPFGANYTGGVDVAWIDLTHLAVTQLSGGSDVRMFYVDGASATLINAAPAFGNTGAHVASIGDLPAVSIDSVSHTEGDAGTVAYTFTITLDHASFSPVVVNYATADGTATAANGDYAAAFGTLVFDPGETSKTVTVQANGDTTGEGNETFTLHLLNPVNAIVSVGAGTGTIGNDDPPVLSISDVTATEGDQGGTTYTFTVSLNGPALPGGVTFDIATSDNTALDGSAPGEDADYVARALTGQTIPEGESTYTFSVTVNGDTVIEGNQSFFVNVTNIVGAVAGDTQGLGVITEDDTVVFEGNLADRNETVSFAENTTAATNTPNGTLIFDVNANDGDGGATDAGLSYAISAGNIDVDGDGAAPFTIDAASGIVTVNDADDLDFEARPAFALTIRADDGDSAHAQTATLTVKLTDQSETFTVTTLDDEASGGGSIESETSDGNGLSLREALAFANNGAGSVDTIVFDPSLTGGTLALVRGEVVVSGSVTIDGDVDGDGSADITISGNNASRVLFISGAGTIDATLNGLVIRDGLVSGDGGGIFVGAADTLRLTNSVVAANRALDGGGIYGATGAAISVVNSTIADNRGRDGGGVHAEGALDLVNSTVSGNYAVSAGGGLYAAEGAPITLVNSTVSGNRAAVLGGGIFGYLNNAITLINATVTGNASQFAGGIFDDGASGRITLTNSIVAGNAASVSGPDLYGFRAATLAFTGHNIIGSDPASFPSTDTSGGSFLKIDGADEASLATVFARVGNDPDTGVLSGVLADNGGPVKTVALDRNAANPAIDTGTGTLPADTQDLDHDGNRTEPLPVDARGFARDVDFDGVGGTPDLGAFEVQNVAQPLVVTTLSDTGLDATVTGDLAAESADGGGLSLREAVILASQDPDGDPTTPTLITFARALSGGTLVLANGDIALTSNVAIDGDVDDNGTADITVSGADTTRVFKVDGGSDSVSVTLQGLVITHGRSSAGAGIYVGTGDALRLVESTVSDNSASSSGGGIFLADGAEVTAIRATLAGNTATLSGGGIFTARDAEVTLAATTLAGNAAGDDGGGIYGGVDTAIALINTTLSGNRAGDLGGGIYGRLHTIISLDSSTLTGNRAGTNGGGIHNYGTTGLTTLTNSIVAGNVATVGAGEDLFGSAQASRLIFAGANLIGSTPLSFQALTGTSPAQINGANQGSLETVFAAVAADPHTGVLSGVLARNGGPVDTVAIRKGGFAQDIGNPSTLPSDVFDLDQDGNVTEQLPVDARGASRVQQALTDVGAFEIQALAPANLVVTTLGDSGADVTISSGDYLAELADGNGLSLREALALANANADTNTITFAADLGGGTLTLANGELAVSSNVTIDGDTNGDGNADVTISGHGASRVFNIAGAGTIAATLNGLVIRDGSQSGFGSAAVGGGISVGADDALTLTNATVSGNSVSIQGGGIYGAAGATIKLVNSIVSGNSAGVNGGGVFGMTGSTVALVNSTVSGNDAGGHGGGIFGFESTVTLTNTTVVGNDADDSGGGIGGSGVIVLTNATISGNSARFDGGGVWGIGAEISLTNSTISGNRANDDGGGLFNGLYYSAGGPTTLTNSIVAGNTAGHTGNDLGGGGTPLVFTGSNIIGSAPVGFSGVTGTRTEIDGGDQAALESVFDAVGIDAKTNVLSGVLANNGGPVKTIAIAIAGIAHNKGVNALALFDHDGSPATAPIAIPTDARGLLRIAQGTVDVGAFEAQNAAPTVAHAIADQVSPVNVPVNVQFAADAFADADSSLTFSATGLGGIALPAWLTFDGAARTFSGTPPQNFIGDIDITVTADDGELTVSDTFRLTISNAGNDLLVSGPGPNSTGVGDIFALIGGAGDDTYAVSDEVADITEEVGGGADTVYSTVTYTMANNVEGMVLQELGGAIDGFGSDGNDTIFGNSFTNVLHGGAGSDALIGGGGSDVLFGDGGIDGMAGGAGDDTYVVDATFDQIQENAGEGADTVYASASFTLPDNIEGLVLQEGAGAIDGTGSEGSDTIIGNSANNVLNGRGGNDALIGGDGNDVLIGGSGIDGMAGGLGDDIYGVDDTLDQIQEQAGQGADTVYASASFTLFANLEALVLVDGAGPITGTGNGEDNYLFGNDSANVLHGLGGNDVLFGGAGGDTLVGDGGDDVLTGGVDDDLFVFGPAFGRDTIADFAIGDHIVFDHAVFADFLAVQAHMVEIDTTTTAIIFDDQNMVAVRHAAGVSLTQNDFLFA